MPAGTGASCPDALRIEGVFTPTDASHAECYAGFDVSEPRPILYDWRDPPTSCVTDWAEGATVPVTLEAIFAGSCAPVALQLPAGSCDVACL
jgi:hypothetical protein